MEHFTTTSDRYLLDILERKFGYTSFRFPQQEVIETILSGQSCFAIMPTGSGKSLCFQLLSFILKSPIVVISPLISLMEDQVREAQSKAIKAVAIHSANHFVVEDLRNYQLIYCSPERLQSERFVERIKLTGISLIVVDEAHCISRWGHEFRPAYQRINQFVKVLGDTLVLALTATASQFVRKDICQQLRVQSSNLFCSDLYRSNLSLSVRLTIDKELYLLANLSKTRSSIVYVRNRSHTETLAYFLSQHGIPAKAFHAKLTNQEKKEAQDSWYYDQTKCIVATNAFGMGINKPSVHQVFHYHIPDSVEDYIQEIGRAGRDGKDAHCELLYTNKELIQLKKACRRTVKTFIFAYEGHRIGSRVRMYGFINRKICRYQYLLDYFGQELQEDCRTCDHCMSKKNIK